MPREKAGAVFWSRTACLEKGWSALTFLWAGHNRTRSRSPQPRCYTAITVMLPGPLLSPATWAGMLWCRGLTRLHLGCALGSLQCPCSHHCVNTSGTGLNQRELLCAPLPGIPAKTCPAQPPSRRTQTHGPTSCQAYREECQSNQCSYLHTRIAFPYWDIFIELGLTLLPLGCHHRLSAAVPFSFELLRRSSQQSFWF